MIKKFKVKENQKLIDFVSQKLDISKKKAKSLIDKKIVFVNNRRIWISSFLLKKGDIVEIPYQKLNTDLQILYEDNFIIAVNKPPFLVTDKEKGSLEQILQKKFKPTIKAIHRLDKETSGVLLFAKDITIFEVFKTLWKKEKVKKIYYAVCHNKAQFKDKNIKIEIDNKKAHSYIRVLATSDKYTLFTVYPFTGRKHQIRIHLSKIGFPIVGDKLYNRNVVVSKAEKNINRHLLHSKHIEFVHPLLKKKIKISAPVFEDMKQFVKKELKFNIN